MAPKTAEPAVGESDATVPDGSPLPLWRRPSVIGLAGLVVVALVAFAALRISLSSPPSASPTDVHRAVSAGIAKAEQQRRAAPPDAATAYRRIAPSMVTVTAGTSLGAGVVINDRGTVLTALHVITGAGNGGKPVVRIMVRFADGTRSPATVAKRQPDHDIAVLAPQKLPGVVVPAVIGGSAGVGDAVFPVGNPLGLEDSLSAGVVSALNRSIRTESGGTLSGLIQFDAAVNPGNSGGPLLDRDGAVVGIVTGLANPSGRAYFVGIGFAVPIQTAGGAAGGPSK